MTKEPIMILDVNVSECEYHSLNKFGNSLCDLEKNPIARSQSRMCEQNPICPYKVRYDLIQKLKHKEQECEEWKNKYYSSTTEVKADLIKQLDQLKEKNKWYDHYKESALRNKELYNDLSTKYDQLKARSEETIDGLLSVQYQLADNCRKYEQALQEIKGIVFELMKADKSYKFDKYSSKILQKCEVINE